MKTTRLTVEGLFKKYADHWIMPKDDKTDLTKTLTIEDFEKALTQDREQIKEIIDKADKHIQDVLDVYFCNHSEGLLEAMRRLERIWQETKNQLGE